MASKFHRLVTLFTIGIILFMCISTCQTTSDDNTLKFSGKQTWGYVEVRPGAQMFWWLYYSTAADDYTKRPLILWLQGGPGGSSTGFGNFMEIGPLDVDMNNRTHSWVNYANVLFIDNPVGSGFSYVNDTKLLCTNNTQITADLLTLMTQFLQKVPEFQDVPLYIFSESYGGKMAAQFTLRLYKKIMTKKIKCNLKGVSLGDSWISPEDSILTWAPYLFSTSLVDNAGFAMINESAYLAKAAIAKEQWVEATQIFDKTETIISQYTNNVDVYNILQFDTSETSQQESSIKTTKRDLPGVDSIISSIWPLRTSAHAANSSDPTHPAKSVQKLNGDLKKIGRKWLKKLHGDPLSELMNGKVRDMLSIIPKGVVWGAQSQAVFTALAGDFMKPVVGIVETLLNTTPLRVNVYTGQLDMIVDTIGTVNWVEKLNWPGIKPWRTSVRKPIKIANSTEMFVKEFKNFGFYWVLKAGHMVPTDAPATASQMMQLITNLSKN